MNGTKSHWEKILENNEWRPFNSRPATNVMKMWQKRGGISRPNTNMHYASIQWHTQNKPEWCSCQASTKYDTGTSRHMPMQKIALRLENFNVHLLLFSLFFQCGRVVCVMNSYAPLNTVFLGSSNEILQICGSHSLFLIFIWE